MNNLINTVSMTSVEIAALVGSRHDNVKVSIERLAERGVIRLPAMQVSENINKLGFNVQQWLTRKLLEHGMLTVAGAAA